MRRSLVGFCLLLLAPPALAQTGDQARITLGVSGGLVTGGALWSVDAQPFTPTNAIQADTLSLARSLNTSFTFGLTTSYFPSDHLGFTGEIALLGLGSKTTCSIKSNLSGSSNTTDLCGSLAQSNTASSSVGVSLGVAYRIASRQDVSPFVSARIGALISEESTIDLRGYYFATDSGGNQITQPVFSDPNKNRIDIYAQLTAGFVFAVAHGYQFRLEGRDNYVRLPVPLGPSNEASGAFPRGRAGKHLFSVVLGFDIVLEKKRGRRY